jgi:membrane associated rhomboid family serine protease
MGGGVAWWAHVGGFLAGLALMPLLASLARSGNARRDSGQPDWFGGQSDEFRRPDDY